jgi:hypothetical protein
MAVQMAREFLFHKLEARVAAELSVPVLRTRHLHPYTIKHNPIASMMLMLVDKAADEDERHSIVDILRENIHLLLRLFIR